MESFITTLKKTATFFQGETTRAGHSGHSGHSEYVLLTINAIDEENYNCGESSALRILHLITKKFIKVQKNG